jgi:hypothetical protein
MLAKGMHGVKRRYDLVSAPPGDAGAEGALSESAGSAGFVSAGFSSVGFA